MKMPRYKIVSDGAKTQGTKVIDLETGAELEGVTGIRLSASVNDLWRAEIDLVGVAVEVSVAEKAAKIKKRFVEFGRRIIDFRSEYA